MPIHFIWPNSLVWRSPWLYASSVQNKKSFFHQTLAFRVFFSLQLLFRMIAHHNANPFRLDWQPNILITVSASHTAVPKRKHSKWPEHNSNVQIGSRGVSSRHTHSIKCDDSNKQASNQLCGVCRLKLLKPHLKNYPKIFLGVVTF